jgi:predicted amidohydrolase YtcJ
VRIAVALVSFWVAIPGGWAGDVALAPGADWILYDGDILAVDPAFSRHAAIAIGDGVILAVGTRADAEEWAGERTRRLDLDGKTVLPGLIDNHNHLLLAALASGSVDLSGARSIAELTAAIARHAKRVPPGELIVASRAWHESQLRENRLPTRRELDEAAPDHPVYVPRGGHTVILNSRAIAAAGVDADTPVPPGGKVTRDEATGELTGEFIDRAIELVSGLLPPPPDPGEMTELLMAEANRMLAAGYTSIRDAAVEPPQMRLYQALWEQGSLPLRIGMMPRFEPLYRPSNLTADEVLEQVESWGVRSGFGDPMLRIDAVKLMVDGGFEGGLMREPYAEGSGVPPDFHGLQLVSDDKLAGMITGLNRAGWRVGTHVVGDRAMDLLLDAYEQADRDQSIVGRRWTLEHALLTRPEHIPRIKALGLVVSAHDHAYVAGASLVKYWGAERANAVAAVKDLLAAGIVVGGGTDWPVVPYSPFAALYYWISRDTVSAGPLGIGQRLTREQALRMYTINNAYITFEEDVKGSLEPGKYADLVIIDRDYMAVPEKEIRDIRVMATMVAGAWRYRGGGLRIPE